jgi:hypothetical protein
MNNYENELDEIKIKLYEETSENYFQIMNV